MAINGFSFYEEARKKSASCPSVAMFFVGKGMRDAFAELGRLPKYAGKVAFTIVGSDFSSETIMTVFSDLFDRKVLPSHTVIFVDGSEKEDVDCSGGLDGLIAKLDALLSSDPK